MRNKLLQTRARKLRNQSTEAERLLWRHLRSRQVAGFKFRRQAPIAGYIADFACLDAKLVIELDGGQHQTAVAHDAHRDARMGIAGYRVLRFWNNQVFEETASVPEVILNELLALRPHPVLPPRRGKGSNDTLSRRDTCLQIALHHILKT